MNLTVYGVPVPKARPRMTKTGHVYTPKKTADYEFLVQQVWHYAGRPKIAGAIRLEVVFYYARPKSAPDRHHHTGRPDLDNLIKAVLDGLNGYAFDDDSQVVEIHARKQYTDAKPRAEIVIEPVAEF